MTVAVPNPRFWRTTRALNLRQIVATSTRPSQLGNRHPAPSGEPRHPLLRPQVR